MESLPPSAAQVEITRHNAEVHQNLRYWTEKPQLRQEYSRFYNQIAARLIGIPEGKVLECGSGIGNLKSAIPHAITSDLFPNPWLDRQENIYALSFEDSSLTAIVLFDVFHHLEFPGDALAEIYRALRPGGRVVLFEPAAGLLGRIVLGLFHHEPLALKRQITWFAPEGFEPREQRYYAAQGNSWRIFGGTEYSMLLSDWKVTEVAYFPALRWLLTGGFRGPSLIVPLTEPFIAMCERVLNLAPRLFASRMLVVLEKPDGSSAARPSDAP